jgi:hypothetical protein
MMSVTEVQRDVGGTGDEMLKVNEVLVAAV